MSDAQFAAWMSGAVGISHVVLLGLFWDGWFHDIRPPSTLVVAMAVALTLASGQLGLIAHDVADRLKGRR